MSLVRWSYTIPLRLRSIFRRSRVERELDDELRDHVDRQIEEHVARGMDPALARTLALRAFGGIERHKDDCRDARGVSVIENLNRDVRYAMRTLRRAPTFSAVAVLTLALGIGASTAIFSVVDAVLLRSLPYRDADRLIFIQHAGETVAAATFLDWKAGTRTVEQMSAAEYWTAGLTGSHKPQEVAAIRVTADHLPLLGVQPGLGRLFTREEERAGSHRVVVLGFGLWQRRFGGDASVIGRTIPVNGEPYTIVGVMPPGFQFVPLWAEEAELAAPLVLDSRRHDRQGSSLRVFGRLRDGVTLEQAQGDLTTLSDRMAREHPGTDQRIMATPLRDAVVGSVRVALIVLFAAVACVLLIACANVAHLQLMRATAREREFSVRAALGGSRLQLIQQSLVESGMMALAGGMLGVGLAHLGLRSLLALAPVGHVPRIELVTIDGRALLFSLGTVAVAALVFGLGPALAVAGRKSCVALRDGSKGSGESWRRSRFRSTLVISELAMALVLMVAAGLILRSFQALKSVDTGYDVRNVISMTVSVKGTKQLNPVDRRATFFAELERRVRALPDVDAAGTINHLPMHGDHWRFPYVIDGRPLRAGERASASFRVVRPGYFRAMRIPLVAGRDFAAEDEAAGRHVAVVNESMARRWWPGKSPLGQRLSVDDPSTGADWFTVVGVVGDVRQGSLTEGSSEEMYFPYLPGPKSEAGQLRLATFLHPEYLTLVVRTPSDPSRLIAAVEAIVHSMERDAPVSNVTTMEQVIAEEFAQPRFYLLVFGLFAAIAMMLAVVGVYGVISYSVARRTREIGLRLALGAPPGSSFRLVIRQGMRVALVGIGLGLMVTLIGVRYLQTLLFGVEPTDATTLASSTLLLLMTALVACSLPAWRAERVDPMEALRVD